MTGYARITYQNTRQGFSLVELSIVLVILGLLVGGVLSGQSLIRAAELRKITSDFSRYTTAVYTFRDKYFALPGDMTNAQSFWGVRSAGTDLVCQQTISTTSGTCNSDGNGQVNYISSDSTTLGERFLFWQHLAYAGLVEGSYTGASGSTSSFWVRAGINAPVSARNITIMPNYVGAKSGDANYFDGAYGFNALYNQVTVLRPEEVWNIDTKLDDGKPATGRVFTLKASSTFSPNCADGDTAAAGYALTNSSTVCQVLVALP